MFLWKLILTFTDIDYSLVKRQEKEECFALWAVKQKQLIKLKVKEKKGEKVKKKTKQVCVGGGQKIFHTKSICWSECTFAKKKMKK